MWKGLKTEIVCGGVYSMCSKELVKMWNIFGLCYQTALIDCEFFKCTVTAQLTVFTHFAECSQILIFKEDDVKVHTWKT